MVKKNKYENVFSHIKNYNWKSVFFEYFRPLFFAIIFVFFLYNLVMYFYFGYFRRQDLKASADVMLVQMTASVDMVFAEAGKSYNSLLIDTNFLNFIQLEELPQEEFEKTKIIRPLLNTFSNIMSVSEYLYSIELYSIGTQYVISSKVGGDISKYTDTAWHQKYKQENNGNFMLAKEIENVNVISVGQTISLYNNGEIDGICIVNINTDKLNEIVGISGENDLRGFWVSDDQNNILYKVQKQGSVTEPENIFVDYQELNNNRSIMTPVQQGMRASAISDNGLVYTIEIGLSNNKKFTGNMYLGAIIGGVIFLILSTFFAFYTTTKMYLSIEKIISLFKAEGNVDVDTDYNETMFILKNIVTIIDRNKRIEEELAKRLTNLKRSQTVALQTQMNPHFLFNTLQMISLYIQKTISRDNEATRILSILSDLLRITLNTKENIVLVEHEIKYSKKYIEIQKIRYEDEFEIQWNVQPETLRLKTIKLLIQPLVENAIIHGALSLDCSSVIKIEVLIESENLLVIVEDNGIGMTEEKVRALVENIEKEDIAENRHIGLQNLNQRIKLIFGDDYGLKIESRLQEGTVVKAIMPMIEE